MFVCVWCSQGFLFVGCAWSVLNLGVSYCSCGLAGFLVLELRVSASRVWGLRLHEGGSGFQASGARF